MHAARAFLRRIPLAVWLAGLALVLAVRFPVKFLLDPPFLMDYEVYRFIAERVLHGDALHLYAPTTSERMIFKYGPCWAVLLAPLGWFPAHLGAVAWSALNVLWVALTGWLADRLCRLRELRPPPFLVIPAVLLLVRPVTAEFLLGQSDLLWGALMTAFVFCDATERRWAAAVWLALAISLKLPALLFLIYLILVGRWASAGRAVACVAAVNVAAALLLLPSQPWALAQAWSSALAANASTYAFDISNQSLLALAGRLLRQDGYGLNLAALPDRAVMAITAAVQLAVFGLLFLRRRTGAPPSPPQRIHDGALLIVCAVLFSPSGWLASYSALLYPVALALATGWARPPAAWRQSPVAVLAAALVLLSALTHAKLWRLLGVHALRGESYVYLVLMILPCFGLCLLWWLWGARRVAARYLR